MKQLLKRLAQVQEGQVKLFKKGYNNPIYLPRCNEPSRKVVRKRHTRRGQL